MGGQEFMPGETAGMPNEVLSRYSGVPKNSVVSSDDLRGIDFGLSPEEEAVYNESQKQFQPSAGPLPVSSYYPNQGDPTAQGSYSGSWNGGSISATQYAPNGALVPIAMWDARDAAIQKSAMMKAKDVQDWKKKNEKAPTSKLTNINDKLRDDFFKTQDDWWNRAMKAAGGDANKAKYILENNNDYQNEKKAHFDRAEMGNEMVNKIEKIRSSEKEGYIVTPELQKELDASYSIADSNSDYFRNTSANVMKMNTVADLNDSFNTAIKDVHMQQMASAGVDTSDPDMVKDFERTTKSYTPEQIEQTKASLYRHYGVRPDGSGGNSYANKEAIDKMVDGYMGAKIQTSKISSKLRSEDKDGIEDLDINNISNEKGSLLGTVAGTGKDDKGKYGSADKQGTFTQLDGLTLQKPVKVVIPASADVTDMTTGRHRTDKAVRNATLGGIYNGYTYNGQLLDDEGLSKLSDAARKKVKVTPMATVIFKEQKKINNKLEDVETTGHIPLEQVKNPIVGKNKKNEKFFEEYHKKAEERTAELHKGNVENTAKSPAAEDKSTFLNYKGVNYTKSQIEEKAQANGVTVDEYVEWLNSQK